MSAPKRPKCIVPGCKRNATRWDGGICGMVVDSTKKRLVPGYIVWLCTKHDSRHKHFDLPEDPDAIADIALLREELQKLFVANFEADEKNQKLQDEVNRWRRLYLDKPEDRLWHDSDQTWWLRKDDTYLGAGGLFRAEPPEPIKKLMAENVKLREALKRAKRKKP